MQHGHRLSVIFVRWKWWEGTLLFVRHKLLQCNTWPWALSFLFAVAPQWLWLLWEHLSPHVYLILGCTELETGHVKMSVSILCFLLCCFSHIYISDLQESCLTWSPLGLRGPSHTPRLLSLTSFGKSHKDPETLRLPHGRLQAWPTPSPRPRGAETPWAWWLAGAAPTLQVCVCVCLCIKGAV